MRWLVAARCAFYPCGSYKSRTKAIQKPQEDHRMPSANPAAPAPESQDRPARLAPRPCYGLAAPGRGERLFPWAFERRALRPDDIAVSIRFCGVCHSDLHAVRGSGPFPLVPGHEIVGEVTAVGIAVTRFKPGDAALVGTIVGSCGQCDPCKNQTQQYCRQGVTTTYGGKDRIDGSITRGGYANEIVVNAGWMRPASRRCCARASPPGRRSSTGAWGRA
jgi:Alcohol dehydrogenase GroES-like domain